MTGLRISTERASWLALAASMLAAGALVLWLDRGTTYNIDQIRFFLAGPDLDLAGLLEPQNGNLLLTTTLAYKLILNGFGADFVAFRIIHVVVALIAAGLAYALLKPRIGPIAALAPTIVLLFLGSDWWHTGTALGFTVLSSIAAGLGALLLLERDDRVGDLGGCALLVVSVASFSTGLAFLVGVGVGGMLRPDRWRRVWVWGVPLALYLGWWLWARGGDSPSQEPELSNLLLVPSYAYVSLAAVLASLTGLNYDFSPELPPNLISPGAGYLLAIVAIGLLCLRIVRGRVPAAVWVGLAIVLTYWTLGALVLGGGIRDPTKTRYMYPGAVMVLLVASAAVAGVRPSRRALVVMFTVAAIALATNLMLLRNGTAWLRNEYSPRARAQFAMLDLAAERVDPRFDPLFAFPYDAVVSTPAGPYLTAAGRFGSPGFTLAELAEQPEPVRALADQILAGALGTELEPSTAAEAESDNCARIPSSGGAVAVELPGRGAGVRMASAAGGTVRIARFADLPAVEVGKLAGDTPATLELPGDSSPVPWRMQVTTPKPLDICGDFLAVRT